MRCWKIATSVSEASGRSRSSASRTSGHSFSGGPPSRTASRRARGRASRRSARRCRRGARRSRSRRARSRAGSPAPRASRAREQRRARHLEAALAQRAHDAELSARVEQLGVGVRPERSASSAPSIISGRSSSNGSSSARVKSSTSSTSRSCASTSLDRLEVEPVGLHLLDQLQAGDVLGRRSSPCGRGPRGRQEAARLVGADVAHRHADSRASSSIVSASARRPRPSVSGFYVLHVTLFGET